jgi:hypothetical protein
MTETHAELPLNRFWTEWTTRAARQAAPGWVGLVHEMGGLQEAFAASRPPQETVHEVSALLARARELLAGHQVGDEDQLFGRFLLDPTRGQTFSPAVRLTSVGERTLTGETAFGRFHSGSYSAAHGDRLCADSTALFLTVPAP